MRQTRNIADIDQRNAQRSVRRRMRKNGDLIVAVDRIPRIPAGNCPERRKSIGRAFGRSQRAHARRAEHSRVLERRVTFFGGGREIVMKDPVDQENNVVVARGALDVATRRGRQVIDAFDRRTILRRQRGTGEDRQMTVSVHAAHLAERDTLTWGLKN